MRTSGDWDEAQSDADLLRAYASGSQAAFAALMKRHADFVYSAAVRQVRDAHLAEDVTQAVFLVLSQKAGSLKAGTVLVAWLHRTTRYCAANALRMAAHRRFHENEVRHVAVQKRHGEAETIDWGRLSAVLDDAINRLPAKQRQAILLRYFSRKTHAQVGAEIGLSTDAAVKQIQRGLARLRGIVDRAGLAMSAPMLAHTIQGQAIQAAPPHLLASIKAGVLKSGTAATASALSTSIAKGAIEMMRWAKIKLVAALAASTTLVVAGGVSTALVATSDAAKQDVRLQLVSSGATKQFGYFVPSSSDLSDKRPATVKKLPAGLSNPLYTVLRPAGPDGAAYHVVADEPANKPARLFVDANGDGDLTNDPPVEWKGEATENFKNGKKTKVVGADGRQCFTYQGGATFELGGAAAAAGSPKPASFKFYRFDKADPNHAGVSQKIFYYPEYYMKGEVVLGDKTYPVSMYDVNATGDFRSGRDRGNGAGGVKMVIDLDGGKPSLQYNVFDTDQPFNVGGTTYELRDIAKDGSSFTLVKSGRNVPARTAVGRGSVQQAIAFKAKTMDGAAVYFPQDYKGKIVLLDFWATWCGPCVAEVPGLVDAYTQFHGQGLEILGVSLDQKDATQKVKAILEEKKMTWPQVYDGDGWNSEVAKLYGIESIPAPYLVDGDTGKILATGSELRDAQLAPTIRAALARKKTATAK